MASPIVLTNRAGVSQEFAPEDAAAAYESGEWGADHGTTIPIFNGTEIQQVPISQAHQILQSGHALPSTHEEYQAQELEKQYGDIGHQLLAGASGAASTLTLGVSDAAIRGVGGKAAAESVRNSQRVHPWTTIAGEIGGAILPILATGGAGAVSEGAAGAARLGAEGLNVARGLGEAGNAVRGAGEAMEVARATAPSVLGQAAKIAAAPQNLVSGIGEAVEHGVVGLLPKEAKTLLGQMAVRGTAQGARLGTEGAIYSGTQYLGDQALQEHPDLSASKIISEMGYGALLGGAGGAILGAASPALSELVGRNAGKITSASDKIASAHLGVDESTARSLLNDGFIRAGDKTETVLPRIARAQIENASKLEELQGRLDAVGAKGPKLESLADNFDNKVAKHLDPDSPLHDLGKDLEGLRPQQTDLASFLKTPDGQAKIKALDPDQMNRLMTEGKVPPGFLPGSKVDTTFSRAYEIQAQIVKAIEQETNPAVQKGLKSLQDEVEQSILTARDKAVKKLGSDHEWVQSFNKITSQQDVLQEASEGIQAKLDRKPESTPTSIFSMMAASHLVAGNVPAAVGHLAMQYGKHLAQERAPLAASVLMDKIVAMEGVQRAIARTNARLDQGVNVALGNVASKKAPSLGHGFESFADKSQALVSTEKSIEEHAQSIQGTFGGITQHAPALGSALESASLRSTQYLLSILPRERPINPMQPNGPRSEPSYHEKAQFTRVFDAVHDPISVLHDIGSGQVTPEQVQAIATVHPQLKQDMDKKLLDAMKEAVEPLSYANAVGITMFTGVPADPTLEPQSIQDLQANFAPQPQKAPAEPAVGKGAGTPRAARLPFAKQMSLEPGAE